MWVCVCVYMDEILIILKANIWYIYVHTFISIFDVECVRYEWVCVIVNVFVSYHYIILITHSHMRQYKLTYILTQTHTHIYKRKKLWESEKERETDGGRINTHTLILNRIPTHKSSFARSLAWSNGTFSPICQCIGIEI